MKAKNMKNTYLNRFLYTLNDWKDSILNYFMHRVKCAGYGFHNFANFKQRVLISFA